MTALAAPFGPAQDVRIFAGSDFVIEYAVEDGVGAAIDLTGRVFALVVFDAATEEEILSRSAMAAGESVQLALLGDETRALRDERGRRVYRVQLLELTQTGTDVITDGGLFVMASASTVVPAAVGATTAPPVVQVIRVGDTRQLTYRYQGAPGLSAAQQAFAAGLIDAPTAEALMARLGDDAAQAGAAAGGTAGATAGASAGAAAGGPAGATAGATAGASAGASAAQPAIDAANAAAGVANTKAGLADQKATLADQKATAADTATAGANAARDAANAAAGVATTKAGLADAAAAGAVTATGNAITATTGAIAAATAAANAAAQISLANGPSMLIKPAAGTFPSLADAYFTGKMSLYTSFDGVRAQLRALTDLVTIARASTATYLDSTGVLQTAASGAARIGYHYDGTKYVLSGLLIEPQATNLMFQSNDLSSTGWAKAEVTCTSDGRMIETTNSANLRNARQFYSYTPGAVYTASCVASEITGSAKRYLVIVLRSEAFGTSYMAKFDLATGTVVYATAGAIASISRWSATEWRCSVTQTATSATSAGIWFGLSDTADAGTTYTGDGTSGLKINHLQVEASPQPTSRIVTTTAQVTRVADQLSKTVGAEFNPDGQTALFKWRSGAANAQALTLWSWAADNQNYIRLRTSGAVGAAGGAYFQGVAVIGGVAQAIGVAVGTAYLPSTDYKIAIGFDRATGRVRLCINGTIYETAAGALSPAQIPSGFVTRGVGQLLNGGGQPAGGLIPYLPHPTNPLLDATEYPRLLTAAEMQAYCQ